MYKKVSLIIILVFAITAFPMYLPTIIDDVNAHEDGSDKSSEEKPEEKKDDPKDNDGKDSDKGKSEGKKPEDKKKGGEGSNGSSGDSSKDKGKSREFGIFTNVEQGTEMRPPGTGSLIPFSGIYLNTYLHTNTVNIQTGFHYRKRDDGTSQRSVSFGLRWRF